MTILIFYPDEPERVSQPSHSASAIHHSKFDICSIDHLSQRIFPRHNNDIQRRIRKEHSSAPLLYCGGHYAERMEPSPFSECVMHHPMSTVAGSGNHRDSYYPNHSGLRVSKMPPQAGGYAQIERSMIRYLPLRRYCLLRCHRLPILGPHRLHS